MKPFVIHYAQRVESEEVYRAVITAPSLDKARAMVSSPGWDWAALPETADAELESTEEVGREPFELVSIAPHIVKADGQLLRVDWRCDGKPGAIYRFNVDRETRAKRGRFSPYDASYPERVRLYTETERLLV